MTKKPIWEKEFDEKFLDIKAELCGQHPKDFLSQWGFEIIEMFKSFLATEIDKARQETIEEVVKMVENKIRIHTHSAGCGTVCKALTDIITTLEKLK